MARVEDTGTAPRPALGDAAPGKRDRPILIVLRGIDVGESYRLREPETLLGRGPGADIDIPDEGVSRRHAAVRLTQGGVALADLGSRNGTFVNGRRVEGSSELRDGDKIQLASSTILRFTYADRLDESFQRRMLESALRDALTGAFNRKYFLDRLDREVRFARRHRQALSLIMLDIDEFKKHNDTRGHIAGDLVLADLAAEIQREIRGEDVFARYGGEEFAIVCRATDARAAATFAERLRAAVEARGFGRQGEPLALTISLGVAGLADEHADATALLAAADEALYAAKRLGKNRVQLHGAPAPAAGDDD